MKVALAVEGDLSCLDFAVLLVHLVAHQHDGDVVADAGQVLVPLGDVLVGDTGSDIEHEDGGIGTNVVSLTKTSEFLLAGSVPQGQLDGAVVGVEDNGAHLHTLSGDVLLLELASDVALDEGRLAYTTVSDQHYLEFGHWRLLYKMDSTFLLAPCMC